MSINTVCTLPWSHLIHLLLGNKARERGEDDLGLEMAGWLKWAGAREKAWAIGEADTTAGTARLRGQRERKRNPCWEWPLIKYDLKQCSEKTQEGSVKAQTRSPPASVPEYGITWVFHSACSLGPFYHPCLQRYTRAFKDWWDGEQVQEGVGGGAWDGQGKSSWEIEPRVLAETNTV